MVGSPRRRRASWLVPGHLVLAGLLALLAPPAASGHTGDFRVALIRGSYPDAAAPQYSIEQLGQASGEMETFFRQLSNGRLRLDVVVMDAPGLPPVTDRTNAQDFASAAAAGAAARGASFQRIDALGVIGPRNGCGNVYAGRMPVRARGVDGVFHVARLFDCVTPGNTPGASGVEWGPWAHEIGHMLQAEEPTHWVSHPAGYGDGHNLMDSCYPCGEGIFGLTGPPVNTSGKLSFPDWLPSPEVLDVPIPSQGTIARTYTLDPLGRQTASVRPSGLKIPLSRDGRRYLTVEARTRTGADSWGVAEPRLRSEGVHIHEVDESREPPVKGVWACDHTLPQGCVASPQDARASTCATVPTPSYCYPFALWQPGQAYVDHPGAVTIRVNRRQDAGYSVTVERGRRTPGPDVAITPWLTPPMRTYETVDLWIDSSCNGYAADVGSGGLRYGRRADGTVVGNGDDICANEENRLYARVRNVGDAPARDVRVELRASEPSARAFLGRAPLQLVGTAMATRFPALRALAPGASATVYVPWRPRHNGPSALYQTFDTRLTATVPPVAGEVVVTNQDGDDEQENLLTVDVVRDPGPKPSEYRMRIPELLIDAPIAEDPDPQRFGLDVFERAPRKGVDLVVAKDRPFVDVDEKAQPVPLSLGVPPTLKPGTAIAADVALRKTVVLHNHAILWTPPAGVAGIRDPREHHENAKIDGMSLQARTLTSTRVRLRVRPTPRGFTATGRLVPAQPGFVAIVTRPAKGNRRMTVVRADARGRFRSSGRLPASGPATVAAWWQGDRDSAAASSKPVSVSRLGG